MTTMMNDWMCDYCGTPSPGDNGYLCRKCRLVEEAADGDLSAPAMYAAAIRLIRDEKALADELYETLDRLIPDDGVLGPSVADVKARYREARGR